MKKENSNSNIKRQIDDDIVRFLLNFVMKMKKHTNARRLITAGKNNGKKSRPPVNWWLAQPLKGAITGRAPKGARKIWHPIIISGSRSRAAVFLCLTILATRRRVCILFNRHLIQSIIFFQLVSDIFRNHFLVSPDRVHIISPAPEFS